MQSYDPQLPILRQLLALSILDKLDKCGFVPLDISASISPTPHIAAQAERVYERKVSTDGRVRVKVFTTVRGGTADVPLEVRLNGKDAIRVCATYITNAGEERGLVKEARVHRTGDIDAIVERMYLRMRTVWKAAKTSECCHNCGAPKFVAKSGKNVCAEICWKTDEEKHANEIAFKSRNRHSRRKWRKYS